MKSFLRTMGIIVVIFGIIGTIVLSVKFGVEHYEETVGYFSKTVQMVEKRNWLTTLSIFASCLISVGIVSSILFGLANIIENMEYQNNSIIEIQTKVRELEKSKTKSETKPDIQDERPSDIPEKSGAWKCPHCGTVNGPNANKCWCGQKKE